MVAVALFGRSARAAEGPLLVVVEAPPALDADAAEIRRAIGTELRWETIAPMKTAAVPTGRALIVALDHERIAMSLRTNDGFPIGRVIPAPAERAARLRAIAWLAGNLARDQVTPIVAAAPIDVPSLATIPPTAPATPATEPPPLAVVPPVPVPPGSLSDSPTISTQPRETRSFRRSFLDDRRCGRTDDQLPTLQPTRPGGGRHPALPSFQRMGLPGV